MQERMQRGVPVCVLEGHRLGQLQPRLCCMHSHVSSGEGTTSCCALLLQAALPTQSAGLQQAPGRLVAQAVVPDQAGTFGARERLKLLLQGHCRVGTLGKVLCVSKHGHIPAGHGKVQVHKSTTVYREHAVDMTVIMHQPAHLNRWWKHVLTGGTCNPLGAPVRPMQLV